MDESLTLFRDRAALERSLSDRHRAQYLALRRTQAAELRRLEQQLSQRRQELQTALQQHGVAGTPETFEPNQSTPRALRDAKREYTARLRVVVRKERAHDEEKQAFLEQAHAQKFKAIKAAAQTEREALLVRSAKGRAWLEARLPEQRQPQYRALGEMLDARLQRQERLLTQKWEAFAAEQRKSGVSSPTREFLDLQPDIPRTLRLAAMEYVDQAERVGKLTAANEDRRIGFLKWAIAGHPEPSSRKFTAFEEELLPVVMALQDEMSQFLSAADEPRASSEARREQMQERLAQARHEAAGPRRDTPGWE